MGYGCSSILFICCIYFLFSFFVFKLLKILWRTKEKKSENLVTEFNKPKFLTFILFIEYNITLQRIILFHHSVTFMENIYLTSE
jgi:hypothetical protein